MTAKGEKTAVDLIAVFGYRTFGIYSGHRKQQTNDNDHE